MESVEKTQEQPSEERQRVREEQLKEFKKHVEQLPQIAQIAAYSVLDLALRNTSMGEKMCEILWPHVSGSALLEESDTEKGWWLDLWSAKTYQEEVGKSESKVETEDPEAVTPEAGTTTDEPEHPSEAEGRRGMFEFIRRAADKLRPASGLNQKFLALLSILTGEEKESLFKAIERRELFISSAVGNEGLVLMLFLSLWSKETKEGREFCSQVKDKQERESEDAGDEGETEAEPPVLKEMGSGDELDDALAKAILTKPAEEAYKNIKRKMAEEKPELEVGDEDDGDDENPDEPQDKLAAEMERIISAVEEKILGYARSLKQRCDRQVLERALERLGDKTEDEDETGTEPKGDPNLKTIKRWFTQRSYTDRLTGVLLWQLINKEHTFEKPDRSIGNDYFKQWEDEIIERAGDPEYLENAPADEAAVTATTAIMIAWQAKQSDRRRR